MALEQQQSGGEDRLREEMLEFLRSWGIDPDTIPSLDESYRKMMEAAAELGIDVNSLPSDEEVLKEARRRAEAAGKPPEDTGDLAHVMESFKDVIADLSSAIGILEEEERSKIEEN